VLPYLQERRLDLNCWFLGVITKIRTANMSLSEMEKEQQNVNRDVEFEESELPC